MNGNLIFASGGSLANSPINLNVGSLTVNAATTIGNLHGGGNPILNVNAALIIGDAPIETPEPFNGSFAGTGSLTIAAGDHEFTKTPALGTSAYSGNVNLNGGSTLFGAGLFAENLVTINADAAMDMAADTTLGGFAGTGTTDLNFDLTFGRLNQDNTYSGDLTGDGALNKNGSGTWTFNATKTGSGQVNINAGTLGGSGGFAANLSIGTSASVNPGASTGTITAASVNFDGVYISELDGNSNDRLSVSGDLVISSNASLNISEIGPGATASVYIITSYGTLRGAFATVQNLPEFYTLNYAYNNGFSTKNIALVRDTTPPTITSFTAITSSPTDATEIEFSVTFSEDVLNFNDANDVSALVSGTAAYTGVVITGTGSTYTIQYTGVSGDGDFNAVVKSVIGGARDAAGNILLLDVMSPAIAVAPVYCNNSLADGTVNGNEEFEACEHLFTDTDFLATEFATVIFAAGEGITINPNFTLDVGAILQVKVCGQSLCEVSNQPMELGCHSCVTDICAIDISCCTDAYSQACLDKVSTVCNLSCQ